jgi:hypothetical protein
MAFRGGSSIPFESGDEPRPREQIDFSSPLLRSGWALLSGPADNLPSGGLRPVITSLLQAVSWPLPCSSLAAGGRRQAAGTHSEPVSSPPLAMALPTTATRAPSVTSESQQAPIDRRDNQVRWGTIPATALRSKLSRGLAFQGRWRPPDSWMTRRSPKEQAD